MGLASYTPPNDGTEIKAKHLRDLWTALSEQVNGNLDGNNFANGSIDYAKLSIPNGSIDGDKITDASIPTAKYEDDSITDSELDYPRFWQEIARTTLGVAGDTITVSSIPARKYLRFLFVGQATGGTIDSSFTLNGDTGANYSSTSLNGGAFGTGTSLNNLALEAGATASGQLVFASLEFVNLATYQKLGTYTTINNTAAGAGTAPSQYITNVKWANSSSQISSITWTNGGTGDFAIGSEIVVLGHD